MTSSTVRRVCPLNIIIAFLLLLLLLSLSLSLRFSNCVLSSESHLENYARNCIYLGRWASSKQSQSVGHSRNSECILVAVRNKQLTSYS